MQALSKAPASSPRDLEEAPSNDAGSHSLRKHHKFLYVVLIMLLMPLRFPKKELEAYRYEYSSKYESHDRAAFSASTES